MRKIGIAKVTYSTGISTNLFRTEKVKYIENVHVSILEKSIENGTFSVRRFRKNK
jgi:hypothetical protein